MSNADWTRVSRQVPCPVCGKGDWCTVSVATGAVCCMRVQSEHPAANGGWMHGGDGRAPGCPAAQALCGGHEDPALDADRWWRAVRRILTPAKLDPWALTLGLPRDALYLMGACTLGEMLAFPMRDGIGAICGIRTRYPDGRKMAVRGSRAGVFLPFMPIGDMEPLICEGPTDATAALALGFHPIGRPSCLGCERHVLDTCRRLGYQRVTICADSDAPGVAGARKLADVLRASRIAVRSVTAGGHKDLREWFNAGAVPEQVRTAWSQAEWRT